MTCPFLLTMATLATASGISGPAEVTGVADRSGDEDPVVLSNRLFGAAKASQAAGDVASACEAFDRSYALVPRIGTLLNLGLCREQQGRLLLARGALQTALALLTRGGGRRDRLEIAGAHLRAVEAALSWLTFELPEVASATPMELRLDEEAVDPTKGAVPVEAGEHRILVTAAQHLPRTIELSVGPGPERRNVRIEPLVPAAAAPPPAPEPAASGAARSLTTTAAAKKEPPPSSPRPAAPSPADAIPRGWLWVGGGVAVVAAAIAVVLLSSAGSPHYPPSTVSGTYP